MLDELLSNAPSAKDVKEIQLLQRQRLLKTISTANFSAIAPLLSLARGPNIESLLGLTVNIKVLSAESFPQETHTINRVHTLTTVENLKTKKETSTKNTLYTFRELSSHLFEPFVSVSRDEKGTQVFAYANDQELLLLDQVEGSEEEILEIVREKSINMRMWSLARYVALLKQALY